MKPETKEPKMESVEHLSRAMSLLDEARELLQKAMGGPMYFESNGAKWLIKRGPSVFVSRSGKEDVKIFKQAEWGSRESDGKLYNCRRILAAEDGSMVRDYEAVPNEITVEWLRQAGFIDVAI